MSLSLKHIPCPAGAGCTAYMCLFGGHPTENAASAAPISAPASSPQKTDGNISPLVSERIPDAAPKRPKLNSPQQTPTKQTSPHPPSQPPQSATQSTAAPSQQQPTKGSLSPSMSAQPVQASKKVSNPRPLPAAPLKKESLNPRLIKHSPASHDIRLKLSRMVHQEYKRLNDQLSKEATPDQKRLLLSDQQLITRVLDEEQAVAVGRAAVYTNVMKNNIIKYKRLKLTDWIKERENEVPTAGKKRQLGEMQADAIVVQTGLSPAHEVQLLHRLATPIDGLSQHGYVSAVPLKEEIAKAKDGVDAAKGWEQCDRCEQRFQVFVGRRPEDGALTSGGHCNFHWGKAYFPEKQPGDRSKQPKRYLCCGQQVGDSPGCTTHPNHVFKITDPKRLASVLNYKATPENAAAPRDRAVCFDCEMGFTVYGMELIRLTATSWPDGAVILDILVKPLGEILDLNSRYSGVWPDDFALAEEWRPGDPLVPPMNENSAVNGGDQNHQPKQQQSGGEETKKRLKMTQSPIVARELLFSLVSPSTPLMGHGLENDLNAVRVVHPTLVDTVLAFPHKNGLPFRHGLKSLMSTHLNRRIQVQTGPEVHGHDSAEDARAAGELVRFKLAGEWADMKRAGWVATPDGELVSPPATISSAPDSCCSPAPTMTTTTSTTPTPATTTPTNMNVPPGRNGDYASSAGSSGGNASPLNVAFLENSAG